MSANFQTYSKPEPVSVCPDITENSKKPVAPPHAEVTSQMFNSYKTTLCVDDCTVPF